ncbi:MAG: hypothetical protein ABII79_01960 [bacterium]
MMKLRAVTLIIGMIIATSATGAVAESEENSAIETLIEYFNLLTTGNLESAAQMWSEAALERSSRFGIEFSGIPLKVDAASPVMGDLELMREHLQPPARSITEMEDGCVKLDYSALVKGRPVEHTYYAVFDGGYYWLSYPQDHYSRDWATRETEYFRIHFHPDREPYLNPVTLEAADLFVEFLADRLKLSGSDLKTIRTKKIEYFYCDSDRTVELITGVKTRGMLDLAANDIISSFFPHNHEVVHLLMNISLGSLPLTTHPLLREGLAVCYGGRWGKAPSALIGLGAFLCRENIVTIDSLLTESQFNAHAGSDIAYPVAGLFTSFLLDRLDHRKYLRLYRELSGTLPQVQTLADSTVRQMILTATEAPSWTELISGFEDFVERQVTREMSLLPGDLENSRLLVEADGYSIFDNGEWLICEFTSSGGQPPSGNLLVGFDTRLQTARSAMFDEQYGGRLSNEGYRYGIRFDTNESGLYDYASNQLVAKYILGIMPSQEYLNDDKSKITFRLKKSLLGDVQLSADNCKMIPL